MKIIKPEVDIFKSISRPVAQKDVRLMKYVIKAEVDNGTLLYNNVSKALVFLPDEEDLTESMEQLQKMFFYVPASFDDMRFAKRIRQIVTISEARNKIPYISAFTILTTIGCNARCFYCYEKGRRTIHMSEQVARQTAEFIEKNANIIANTKSKKPEMKLKWFGGEPLFNIRVINSITDYLRQKEIRFNSSMISNAYLFNDKIIEIAKTQWNLKKVQVTLDGTEDIYNKAKNYKNAKGSPFLKVIENISKLITASIKVSVRLNVNIENADNMYQLIEYLAPRFSGEKLFSIYAHEIFNTEDETEEQKERKYGVVKELNAYIQTTFALEDKKRSLMRDYVRTNKCMSDSDRSIVILPDGHLGKCEHYSDDHFIGHIDAPTIIDQRMMRELAEPRELMEKCAECPIFPTCIRLKHCKNDICSDIKVQMTIESLKVAIKQKYYVYVQNTED